MDWGNDYFTFSDTNIEHIWASCARCTRAAGSGRGHRSTEWCPRCGTSISQHELSGSDVYRDKTDLSVLVRPPPRERDGESLVVRTTTPWTLPANVAAAVEPDAEYIPRDDGLVARERFSDDRDLNRARRGARRPEPRGPFDHLPAAAGSSIASSHGTRSRSTRGRASSTSRRPRRRGLRARASTASPSSRPWTRQATSTTYTAGCTGSRRSNRPTRSSATCPTAGGYVAATEIVRTTRTAGAATRRSSSASRTTGSRGGRGAPAAAPGGERRDRLDARVHGQAHGRLALQHGD